MSSKTDNVQKDKLSLTILIPALLLLFACLAGGCSAKWTDSSDSFASEIKETETVPSTLTKTPEYYIDLAMSLKEQGDTLNASKTLEEGYSATQDPKILEILTEVDVSVASGEYENVFNVEIKSLCPVYYTLDGEDPNELSSLYSKPISISDGETLLKAVSITANGTPGAISENKYIVESKEAKVSRLFQTYFFDHFDQYDDHVFLYDVTNDGINEMIVVNAEASYDKSTVQIYAIGEEGVNRILQEEGVEFRNMLSLCNYEDKVCFLENHCGVWQGSGEWSYNIFYLTSEGEQVSLISDQISGTPIGDEIYSAFQTKIDAYSAQQIVDLASSAEDAFGLTETKQKEELYESTFTVQYYKGILYVNYDVQDYYIDHPDYRKLVRYAETLPVSDVYKFIIKDDFIYYTKMINIQSYGSAHDFSYETSPIYRANLDGSNVVEVTNIDSYDFYIIGDRLYCSETDWIDLKDFKAHRTEQPGNIGSIICKDSNYIIYNKLDVEGTFRSDCNFENECKIFEGGTGSYYNFMAEGNLYVLNGDSMGAEYLTCYTIDGELVYEKQLSSAIQMEEYQNCYLSNYIVKDNIMFCEFTVDKSNAESDEATNLLLIGCLDLITGEMQSQIEVNPPAPDPPTSMFYYQLAYVDQNNIYYESYMDYDSTQWLKYFFIVPRNGDDLKIFQVY